MPRQWGAPLADTSTTAAATSGREPAEAGSQPASPKGRNPCLHIPAWPQTDEANSPSLRRDLKPGPARAMGNRSLVLTLTCPEAAEAATVQITLRQPRRVRYRVGNQPTPKRWPTAKRSRRDMHTIPRDFPAFRRGFFRRRSLRRNGVWLNSPGAGLAAAAAQETALLLPIEFNRCEHRPKRKPGPLAPGSSHNTCQLPANRMRNRCCFRSAVQQPKVANHSRVLTFSSFPIRRSRLAAKKRTLQDRKSVV